LTSIRNLLAASLIAAAPPAAPPPPPSSVAPVVEAERAFARLAQEKGSVEAFTTFIAEDGQMFLPEPRRARPLLQAGRIHLGPLRWWPVYAGLAASKDLGFTTGPAIIGQEADATYGFFFTVWKRQPDGRWRWVLDRGAAQRAMPPQGPQTPVASLPVSAYNKPGESAWPALQAAEAALARDMAVDARSALRKVLAADAWLLRSGPPPAVGRGAIAAALVQGPARIAAKPLGGGASAAGDLAYTFGTAAWDDATGARSGYYVRIWQRRARGWKLVIDETTAPPPARPR
jgi:ketosteroid isomerase-like protein